MSGHSKWSQIKRAKEIVDHKKSQLFGKLSKDILVATKTGTDFETNSALRDVIARARKVNMPQINIDRLLEKNNDETIAPAIYEGFGPSGVAFLVTVSTNNPNRTVSEIRLIFKKHGGSLGTPGSVRWKFNDEYIAQYPIQLPPEQHNEIEELRDALTIHPDVILVATDILK